MADLEIPNGVGHEVPKTPSRRGAEGTEARAGWGIGNRNRIL